ncbi:MAG: nucleotidyltransferase family protein, partial [Clostridia bacterium]|nr:nucleotidyltransferase family protein [Clostridia bacterium]
MKAVIMAGGEGKRLRPITCTMPKPMVPLLNKPVIDYCIELLKRHGIEDITATLYYLQKVIKDHCGNGEKYGVSLSYSTETTPMGTAGSVREALGDSIERTIVISG